VSLEDGAKLFRIHFNVLGSDGEQCLIQFTDEPTAREISDTSFAALPAVFEDGVINIGETSATTDATSAGVQLQVAPNPFSETTRISWSAPDNQPVRVVIMNAAGQLIRQFEHPRGAESAFTLRAKDLPASGTYLIELHTKTGKTTHKVAFVKP
jgi:hypothetical protein